MGRWTEEVNKTEGRTSLPIPKMLTVDQVQQILNLGKPMVYALLRSGELRGAQFGPRAIWRIREEDLEAFIDEAYATTAERIARGQLDDADASVED